MKKYGISVQLIDSLRRTNKQEGFILDELYGEYMSISPDGACKLAIMALLLRPETAFVGILTRAGQETRLFVQPYSIEILSLKEIL